MFPYVRFKRIDKAHVNFALQLIFQPIPDIGQIEVTKGLVGFERNIAFRTVIASGKRAINPRFANCFKCFQHSSYLLNKLIVIDLLKNPVFKFFLRHLERL